MRSSYSTVLKTLGILAMCASAAFAGAGPDADLAMIGGQIDHPEAVRFSERAFDSEGGPVEGVHTLKLNIFDAAGDEVIWAATYPKVDFAAGWFSLQLGKGIVSDGIQKSSLDNLFKQHPDLEVEIVIDGIAQEPRVGIRPAGHSQESRAILAGAVSQDGLHTKGYDAKSESTSVQAVNLRPDDGVANEKRDDWTHRTSPYLIDTEYLGESRPVSELPAAPPVIPNRRNESTNEGREINRPRHERIFDDEGYRYGTRTRKVDDRLAVESRRSSGRATPGLSVQFNGIGFTNVAPPDTEGAVGLDHYVQVVNSRFKVFDKSGNSLTSEMNTNTLWSGFGGLCESDNNGDAIFMYDEQADRWVLTQFTSGNVVCFAVSTTDDPTGTFHLYQVNTQRFPDYYKLGVWPDADNNAYFMGTNTGSQGSYDVYALDRANMLAGNSARQAQYFLSHPNLLMPADLDGDNLPPSGQPGIFYTFRDGGESYFSPSSSVDTLDIWEFDVDWNNPANSSFSMVQQIQPPQLAEFNWTVCGFFNSDCLPQPGTSQKIDSASWWPMQRLQYRNFGSYEALVGTWTVDVVSSGDRAAPRWFEMQRTSPSGSWTMAHQGTLSPDGSHRFMPSAALDGDGNMAIGYSIVDDSPTIYPSLHYATRAAGSSTFDDPAVLIAGGGSETSVNRWGDYASMEVDPADDCTFWFTSMYIASTGGWNWSTYVGAFKIPGCSGSGCDAVAPSNLTAGGNGDNRIDLGWSSVSGASEYRIYRSETSGGPYEQIGSVSGSSTWFSDTTVDGSVTYYYVVTTYTDCESDYSNQDSASTTGGCVTPPTFGGLEMISTPPYSTCTLDLQWSAGSTCSGAPTYRVYRSTSSGFTPSSATRIASGVAGTSYSDSASLSSGVTYYYIVRAYDGSSGLEDDNMVKVSGSPVGPATTGTWFDDLEPGADSGWTHDADQGTDDWALTTSASYSSSHSWNAADVATLTDKFLVAPSKNLGSNSVLSFWHRYEFESGYDGGVIEISTNGGSTWTDLGSAITANGYTRTISTGYSSPIGGREAWSGSQTSWVKVSVNLGAYAGSDRLVRWRLACDTSQTGGTWNIDDIQITNSEVYGTCGGSSCDVPSFAGLSNASDVDGCADSGVALSWSAPSNWGDDGSGTRSFVVLRGSTEIATLSGTTTSYTDLSAPADVSLTYSVRATNGCGESTTGGATRNVTNVDSEPEPSFGGLSSVSNSGTTALALSWSAGSAACGSGVRYNVYRSTSSSFTPGAATRIATGVTSTSYTDSGLADGTYYYIVRAEDYTTGHSGPNGGVEDSNTSTRSGTIDTSTGGSDWIDDFEPSADAGWTHAAASGSDDWTLSTASSNSATHAWASEDVPAVTDKYLVSPAKTVSSTSVLTFYHKFDFETGWDGAVLEISANGGAWSDLGSSATVGGYNGTIGSGYSNPLTGKSAWTGELANFNLVQVNLGSYAGQDVKIRWRVGCDSSVGAGFWYVDDVKITDVGGSTSTCDAPTFGGINSASDVNGCADTGVALSWSAPSAWGDEGGTRSFDVLRGGSIIASVSSASTSYTDMSAPVGVSSTYAIRANNGCGESSTGGTTRNATNADTEPEPSFAGLSSVVEGSSCDLVLSWNSGSAACGSGVRYNVYRSTSSSFAPSSSNRIATGITSTSYTDGSVATGTYYYIVRAEDYTSGHSGPNGGVEDSNTVVRSGTLSGGGSQTVTLFDDSFDSGVGLNGWGSGYFTGDTVGWRGIQNCSANSGSGIFRFGGTSCTSNYGNDKFSFVNPNGTSGIAIPADATNTTLNFWHRWAFETRYDGATLLISTDGQNYTFVPSSAITSGSYNNTSATYCVPEGGGNRSIWSGTRSTFTNTVVDLDAAANAVSGNTGGAAGKTIWLAFAVITDCSTTGDGWFLDDVMVTATSGSSCGSIAAPRTDQPVVGDSIEVGAHFDYAAVDLDYEEPIQNIVIHKE